MYSENRTAFVLIHWKRDMDNPTQISANRVQLRIQSLIVCAVYIYNCYAKIKRPATSSMEKAFETATNPYKRRWMGISYCNEFSFQYVNIHWYEFITLSLVLCHCTCWWAEISILAVATQLSIVIQSIQLIKLTLLLVHTFKFHSIGSKNWHCLSRERRYQLCDLH